MNYLFSVYMLSAVLGFASAIFVFDFLITTENKDVGFVNIIPIPFFILFSWLYNAMTVYYITLVIFYFLLNKNLKEYKNAL